MFYLDRFDVPALASLALPLLEARQDTSSGTSRSSFRPLIDGGGYRVLGTEKAPREITRIAATGEYLEAEITDTEELARALKRRRGNVGKLYRRTKGTNQPHWCWAELMAVGSENSLATILEERLTPTFTMLSPCWYGAAHGPAWLWGDDNVWGGGVTWDQADGDTFVLPAGATEMTVLTTTCTVVNGGDHHVDNAILTISASATDALLSPIFIGTTTAQLVFHADIPAASSLVIDCGARRITLGGVNAYDDLEIDAAHTLAGWLRLESGTTAIGITYHTAAAGSLLVTFSDGSE